MSSRIAIACALLWALSVDGGAARASQRGMPRSVHVATPARPGAPGAGGGARASLGRGQPGKPTGRAASGSVPKSTAPARRAHRGRKRARLAATVHALLERPQRALVRLAGGGRRTDERPFFEVTGDLFGVDVGLTVSQLDQVRRSGARELVHVVNPDGTSNLEMVVARKEIGLGQRIEFQGPAINTGGSDLLGARFTGIGLTGDLDTHDHEKAVSYTLEAKLTSGSLLRALTLIGPDALRGLAGITGSGTARLLAGGFAHAIPVVSAALAVGSARRTYRTFKNPRATRGQKLFAVGHLAADVTRVVNPLAGALANVALIGAGAAWAFVELRRGARAEPAPSDGEPAPSDG